MYLPKEKSVMWTQEIEGLIETETRIQPKKIESTIGKLNHAAFLLPHARYFMNNLRKMQYNSAKYGSQHINETTREDLKLWKNILNNVTERGVSINLLTYTQWKQAIYTDVCEHGIGGFNPTSGRALRWELPQWARNFHINILEFLASFIELWIEILDNTEKHARFLCMTDSSSALAWLYKSNFDPNTQKIHSTIARQLATTTMNAEVALYSQHVPGCHNVVADSLSRDHHIDNVKLTFLLKQLYPSRAQENIHILQDLPIEISLWLESLRQKSINKMVLPNKPTRSKMGTLISGESTLRDVASMTSLWINMIKTKSSSSCPVTQQLLEEISMAQQKSRNSLEKQFEPPLATYVRPFGKTFGPIQP